MHIKVGDTYTLLYAGATRAAIVRSIRRNGLGGLSLTADVAGFGSIDFAGSRFYEYAQEAHTSALANTFEELTEATL